MNKTRVVQAILEALTQEFENFAATSKKTRGTGNDAQTKAEGKYDTRSTEENYLADGQAKQAHAARLALAVIAALPVESWDAATPLHVGALVEVQLAAETMWFFLAPAAGGLEVIVDGQPVTVLTFDSPLGAQLKDRRVGDATLRPVGRILQIL